MEKITPVFLDTIDDRALLYYVTIIREGNPKPSLTFWNSTMPSYSEMKTSDGNDERAIAVFNESEEVYHLANYWIPFTEGLYAQNRTGDFNQYLFGAGVRAGLLEDNAYGLRAFLPPRKGRIDQIGYFGHFRFFYSTGAFHGHLVKKEREKGNITDLFYDG